MSRPGRSIIKQCTSCGGDFKVRESHAHLRLHCSRKCMAETYKTRYKGENNPNFSNAGHRVCEHCHNPFNSYNKKAARRFCSLKCYGLSGEAGSNARRNGGFSHGRGRVDANQKEIVDGLRKAGVSVLITSELGRGFPDLVIAKHGINHLVEIKNPKSQYGKRGLNPNQQAFAEWWTGGPVYMVKTLEEALEIVKPL